MSIRYQQNMPRVAVTLYLIILFPDTQNFKNYNQTTARETHLDFSMKDLFKFIMEWHPVPVTPSLEKKTCKKYLQRLKKPSNLFNSLQVPFGCLKTRIMLRVLVSQTRSMPSSDPETNEIPSASSAKQVTALMLLKTEWALLRE